MPDKTSVRLTDDGTWVLTETYWNEDGMDSERTITYQEHQSFQEEHVAVANHSEYNYE